WRNKEADLSLSFGRHVQAYGLFLDEGQQILIDAILVRVGQTVRRTRVNDQLGARDECCRGLARNIERYDLVVITVYHQGGHIELLQVFSEVRGRERGDGIVGVLVTGLHALRPPAINQALRHIGSGAIETVEGTGCDIKVQLRAVLQRGLAQAVEHLLRNALRVVRSLHHKGWNSTDEHGLLDTLAAMAPDVACDFAAAR